MVADEEARHELNRLPGIRCMLRVMARSASRRSYKP